MNIKQMNEVVNVVKKLNSNYDYVTELKSDVSEIIKSESIDYYTRKSINKYLSEISVREFLYKTFNKKENEMTEDDIDEISVWLSDDCDDYSTVYGGWYQTYCEYLSDEIDDLQELLKSD